MVQRQLNQKCALSPLVALQRSIGNGATQRLINSPCIQTKLQISTPNDPLEREADRTAESVLRMPQPSLARKHGSPASATSLPSETDEIDEEKRVIAPKSKFHPIPLAVREDDDEEMTTVQRVCTECEEEEPSIQRASNKSGQEQKLSCAEQKPGNNATTTFRDRTLSGSPRSVDKNINALNAGGTPLSPSTRAFFEPRFGQDFSKVKVHTDSAAAEAAQAINARAFTVGSHISFAAGEFAPESAAGRHLLAHELTHTIQQQSKQSNATVTGQRDPPPAPSPQTPQEEATL